MSIFEIHSFLGLAGYYRRFKNGLKLCIQGRIIGLRLRDVDSMVGTALTIEREIEDVRNTRDTGVGSKREDQPSSSSGKRQKTSASHEFRDQGQDLAFEIGLPPETGIPGLWDNVDLVSRRIGEYTVHSSTPWYGSEEPVLVLGCYASTSSSTDRPEGPECGSRSRTDQSCAAEEWWTFEW